MKKQIALLAALVLACGAPIGTASWQGMGFTASAQNNKVTGVVRDGSGEPLIGATVQVKGTNRVTATDIDGKYSIQAAPGSTLVIKYVGSEPQEIVVNGSSVDVNMGEANNTLDEVVVTALGIKKDRKSLGYAVDDLKSEELMRNKNTNAINSLAGKIAGVNVTQSSGAAGSGAQIILRGGTSLAEDRDNQPLFVVDGVIYDNSTSSVGNSAFDGMYTSATTNSNRVMDINPEDIESMSVLKGPAASALYGSRAAAGVVLITTKSGKEGKVDVNFSTKMMTSWAKTLPKVQTKYKRGYYQDSYDAYGTYTSTDVNERTYLSWGAPYGADESAYDNIGNFFKHGTIWDTNLSVAGGTKNSKFYLSGSYYNQDGIIPTTGFTKTTFRFNGEQKYKIFTFGANVAYSQSRTTKTLTGAGLYGSSGTGALYGVYNWAPSDDMTHYLDDYGNRYRLHGTYFDPWNEQDNPYWNINKNKLKDNTERLTANFSIKADVTDWWWLSYRMGIDTYTTENSNFIHPDGVAKKDWQNGMYSENSLRHQYLSTNLMSNMNKQYGDFNFNLMLGTSTDYTKRNTNYRMAWNFQIPGVYSFDNTKEQYRQFKSALSRHRLVGVFGEFRVDWRNAIFLTVTGRNDWSSTLPKENRSYFYPSVSGAVAFTELMGESCPEWLSFGKIRASWAKVGKDTEPYKTATYLWPVGSFLGELSGIGNSWERGNPNLKPEMTTSTEVGLELRFLQNRLKLDYAYYYNKSTDQILSPRLAQSIGYIFGLMNAGTVINKGMELSISGTPIQTRDFTWETGINIAGNRGTVKDLPDGLSIMYLTDVQYGGAKAASFGDGIFMGISGTRWSRSEDGLLLLDQNFMPTTDNVSSYNIGNREPKFTGGWNNTFTWKNWSFNMLWEFRVGGAVFNGTKYVMNYNGVGEWSGTNRESITISGLQRQKDGKYDKNGTWTPVTMTYETGKTYMFSGVETSGEKIIRDYYQSYYNYEPENWVTKVNSLRLRSISLSYSLPSSLLVKTRVIKAASITATANNLLLFTNYDGDPEVAASGSGIGGSSSVGFDYCGVPATSSFAIGVNLTF